MEGSKNSAKRKLTGINTSKIRKIPNKQPDFMCQRSQEAKNNPKVSRKKEALRITAELHKTGTRKKII